MTFENYLTRYLEALAAKGYAKGTLERHKSYLKCCFGYLEKLGITDVKAVTREQMDAYRIYLKMEYRTAQRVPLAERSFSSHMEVVTTFFRWLEETRQILMTPMVNPIRPKRPEPLKLPEVLSEEEVVKILESFQVNTPHGLRDRAILEVLYSTGIRRSELVNLNVDDFLLNRRELVINQGKGRKDRVVPVGEHAAYFTEAYLKLVRPWLVGDSGEKALFLTVNGDRMVRQTLNVIIRRVVKRSGVQKRVTPHVFRHSMATHLLRNKADLRHVQAILGHTLLQSTEVYTHVTVEDLRQAVKKAHPHGRRLAEKSRLNPKT